MPAFNMDFNPAKVMLSRPSGNQPWANPNDPAKRGPVGTPLRRTFQATQAPQPPTGVLGAEAVRATGAGPYDQSFRQNLATYAGGQFQRPGGYLGFNPTGQTLGGQQVGGGNAPTLGAPNSLMGLGLGGQSFQFQPPTQPKTPVPPKNQTPDQFNVQDWMKQFLMGGQ